MNKDDLTPSQQFGLIEQESAFSVEPCTTPISFEDKNRYLSLNISSGQKMQLSSLLHTIPSVMATGTLAQAYVVKFPEGLPHTLTALHQGGYGSMIRVNGQFAGSASFYPIQAQAVAMGAFSAMSAITGQYYLTEINHQLMIINNKMDDILNFLYGESKAELMSEIEFVKFAHANYSVLMMHEEQRLATITNLQAARKIALKDIEFYLSDLATITGKPANDYAHLLAQYEGAMRAKECIEMARQLYVISGLLELYYSQNFDEGFVRYLEGNMIACINRCDKKIVADMNVVKGKFVDYKAKPFEKVEGQKEHIAMIDKTLEEYQSGNDSPIRTSLKQSIDAITRKTEYYLDNQGQVYIKK